MAPWDFGVLHPRGENEKHLGDGILDDKYFTTQTKSPLRLRMTFNRKWTTTDTPDVIPVVALTGNTSQEDGDAASHTGLELRRYKRIYRRPMELVHRDPHSQKKTLLAVIETTTPGAGTSNSTTTIYSTEPSFQGQVPTSNGNPAIAKHYNSAELYPRATIEEEPSKRKNSNYFEYATILKPIDERNEKSMERATEPSSSSLSITTHYESEEVPGPLGPQTIVRKRMVGDDLRESEGNVAAAALRQCSAAQWSSDQQSLELTIAPGIDPCLILCLSADLLNRQHVSNRTSQQNFVLGSLCCPC